MSRLVARRECRDHVRVVSACWRWSAYVTGKARQEHDKLCAELAKKNLKITALNLGARLSPSRYAMLQ